MNSAQRTLARIVAVAVLVLAGAGPAHALTEVEGTGEPKYTSSTTNTQWVRWQNPGGVDGYRLHVVYVKNQAQVHDLRVGTTGSSGTIWVNWAGVQALQEGNTYAICVRGEFLLSGMWFPESADSCTAGANANKRTSTTIDFTDPTISTQAAGGAAVTRDPAIALRLDFQDANAGPFPANFVCIAAGADPGAACNSNLGHSAACSQPNQPGKSASFDCTLDASALPDGPVSTCAIAADAAVPDNPSGSNQTGAATSANLSAMQCDTVVLDRAGPTLAIEASATSGIAGTAVGFTASASDATSGIAGEVAWSWGDGTAPGSGSAQSHAFSQPGTYRVQARVKDVAGNESLVEKDITVTAAPSAPAGGEGQPSQPSAPGGGSQPPATPAGPTPGDISDAAGGAPVVVTRAGSVTLLVPSRFRLARGRRHLVVGVAATQSGTLTLRLVRGGRIVARRIGQVQAGSGVWRLAMPRRPRAGRYALTMAFTPAGAAGPVTARTPVRVLARRR